MIRLKAYVLFLWALGTGLFCADYALIPRFHNKYVLYATIAYAFITGWKIKDLVAAIRNRKGKSS